MIGDVALLLRETGPAGVIWHNVTLRDYERIRQWRETQAAAAATAATANAQAITATSIHSNLAAASAQTGRSFDASELSEAGEELMSEELMGETPLASDTSDHEDEHEFTH